MDPTAKLVRLGVIIGVALIAGTASVMMQPGKRKVGPAVALGWLIPGLGHVLLGKWKKGLFFFGALGLTYLAGLWIIGFRTVSYEANPFYYVGQFGSGATILLGTMLANTPIRPRTLSIDFYDPGLLYVCVAGLLNLVVMFNCFDVVSQPAAPPKPVPAAALKSGEAPPVPAPKEERLG